MFKCFLGSGPKFLFVFVLWLQPEMSTFTGLFFCFLPVNHFCVSQGQPQLSSWACSSHPRGGKGCEGLVRTIPSQC